MVAPVTGVSWGYARVSTVHQNLALQLDALEGRACIPPERIVTEHASGGAPRPQLHRLIARMRAGDILTVWRLDRLGRSLPDLLKITARLHEQGLEVRSLTEQICTATAHGRLVWSLFGALSQYELELNAERSRAGIKAAKARGVKFGRGTSLATDFERKMVAQLYEMGETTTGIANRFRCSRRTIERELRRQNDALSEESGKHGEQQTGEG